MWSKTKFFFVLFYLVQVVQASIYHETNIRYKGFEPKPVIIPPLPVVEVPPPSPKKGLWLVLAALALLPYLSTEDGTQYVGAYPVQQGAAPVFLPFSRTGKDLPARSMLQYIMAACHKLRFKKTLKELAPVRCLIAAELFLVQSFKKQKTEKIAEDSAVFKGLKFVLPESADKDIVGLQVEQEMFKASGYGYQKISKGKSGGSVLGVAVPKSSDTAYLPPSKSHFLALKKKSALSLPRTTSKGVTSKVVQDRETANGQERTILLAKGPMNTIIPACSTSTIPVYWPQLVREIEAKGYGVQGCAYQEIAASDSKRYEGDRLATEMIFCGLIVTNLKPYSTEVLPSAAKRRKVVWVDVLVTDVEAMLRTVLSVGSESLLGFAAVFAVTKFAAKLKHHHQVRIANLALWTCVVFVIPEIIESIPFLSWLVWGTRLNRPSTFREASYKSYNKPWWAPSVKLMNAINVVIRACQVRAVFLGFEKLHMKDKGGLVEAFIVTQALDHAWKKIFFDHRELGYSMTVSLFVLMGALSNVDALFGVHKNAALYWYLPAVLGFILKAALNVIIWRYNGRMPLLPMCLSQKKTYVDEDI